jgi:agmatinase
MAERVRRLLAELAPGLRVLALGGDHSVTWPVIWPLLEEAAEVRDDLGIVHIDAHTDLLPERLGVTHCFATWAHHANHALGGGQRMIQIGIRASGRDRGHWERTEGVRQIWAEEARARPAGDLAAEIVEHLRDRGVRRVYFSNDIDGTDAHWAAACGTPEPGGLEPEAVCAIIAAVGDAFEIVGADLVELAPGLSLDAKAAQRSVQTAVRYVRTTLTAMARTPAEKDLE